LNKNQITKGKEEISSFPKAKRSRDLIGRDKESSFNPSRKNSFLSGGIEGRMLQLKETRKVIFNDDICEADYYATEEEKDA